MSDEAPVPLAEQIAAVQEHIAYWKRRDRWGKDDKGKAVILGKFDDQLSIWPAVLATLQQHERLTAGLADANERIRQLDAENQGFMREVAALREQHERAMAALRLVIAQAGIPDPGDACRAIIKTAQAALDDAASAAATPAGKGDDDGS